MDRLVHDHVSFQVNEGIVLQAHTQTDSLDTFWMSDSFFRQEKEELLEE